jgi:hypothetical protein
MRSRCSLTRCRQVAVGLLSSLLLGCGSADSTGDDPTYRPLEPGPAFCQDCIRLDSVVTLGNTTGQGYVVSTTEREGTLSVTGSTWKYIRDEGAEELYHRKRDPQEASDVAADFPEVARSLRTLADRHRQHMTERQVIATAARHGERGIDR